MKSYLEGSCSFVLMRGCIGVKSVSPLNYVMILDYVSGLRLKGLTGV